MRKGFEVHNLVPGLVHKMPPSHGAFVIGEQEDDAQPTGLLVAASSRTEQPCSRPRKSSRRYGI